MKYITASRAMRELMLSGYKHYSRKDERAIMQTVLLGLEPPADNPLDGYDPPYLSDEHLRNTKNSLICAVTVMCREAMDLGADDLLCYGASEFFIRKIEESRDAAACNELTDEIIRYYVRLVAEGKEKNYSLTVSRAIRFIRRNLYRRITVPEIAQEIGVHPNYLSSRFREETSEKLTSYIVKEKLREAEHLLKDSSYTVSEIAGMLGFSSVTYFDRVFRKEYGYSPTQMKGAVNALYAIGENTAEFSEFKCVYKDE